VVISFTRVDARSSDFSLWETRLLRLRRGHRRLVSSPPKRRVSQPPSGLVIAQRRRAWFLLRAWFPDRRQARCSYSSL